MPSLIYIARIRSLSEELAKSLRSAGCHVKSFKPGDITQDECLLAMTSEALGTALHHPEGDATEIARTLAATPGAPDMKEPFGSQAAIWNSIKTAVTRESQTTGEPSAEVASTAQSKGMEPGTPHAAVARPAFRPPSRATAETAPTAPSRVLDVSSSETPRTPVNMRPPKEQLFRVFRNPLSTVVALAIFSVVYRGLMAPSTKGVTTPREATYNAQSDSNSSSLLSVSAARGRTVHRSIPPLSLPSAEALPQAVDRVQQRLPHDDSVAKDFTNHFALHAQGDTIQPNPEPKHPQSDRIPKRIVVN